MLVAKLYKIIYQEKKKKLITMNGFGVIYLLFATFRSESGVLAFSVIFWAAAPKGMKSC